MLFVKYHTNIHKVVGNIILWEKPGFWLNQHVAWFGSSDGFRRFQQHQRLKAGKKIKTHFKNKGTLFRQKKKLYWKDDQSLLSQPLSIIANFANFTRFLKSWWCWWLSILKPTKYEKNWKKMPRVRTLIDYMYWKMIFRKPTTHDIKSL